MGGATAVRGKKLRPRETTRGGPTEGWEGGREVEMVGDGGAGLNINPRGRPGRAPVLVRLRLNPRNHADRPTSSSRIDARARLANLAERDEIGLSTGLKRT